MASVILLSGGLGTRFGSQIPKQYNKLNDKEIAIYSFECFLSLNEIEQIVVVCKEDFRALFKKYANEKKISFAYPGLRREDSVYNGFLELENKESLVCIHDAARPFITHDLVLKVLNEAHIHGAATIGVPLKFTIKQVDSNKFVVNTPDRNTYLEIQTPQVISYPLLKKGFINLHKNKLSVTDDVSIVELLGCSVKIVEGDYRNIKITTPDDLLIANQLLNIQKEKCFV